MRRRLSSLWPLLAAFTPLLVAALFHTALTDWTDNASAALSVSPWWAILVMALALPAMPALLFNQNRLSIICGLLFAAASLADNDASRNAALRQILTATISLQVVALTYLRERGLLTRFGLIRLLVAAVPLAAIAFYADAAASWQDAVQQNAGWLLTTPPGMQTPLIVLAVVGVSIAALLRLRGTEYPLLAPVLAAVLVSLVLAMDAPSAIWFGLDAAIARPLALAFSGLLLVVAIYRLSWGRAYRDQLTGLPGRRALEEQLAKLAGNYTLVMGDVDHFKKFNDTFGHDVGDDVLRVVASIMGRQRKFSAYRYGGEEFTLVATGKSAKDVKEALDELREQIEAQTIVVRNDRNKKRKQRGKSVNVTMSFGAASPTARRRYPTDVLKAADKALYRAKNAGRNRVMLAAG